MIEQFVIWTGWSAFVLVQIGFGWLVADFASGVFHWAEDRYGSPK